MEASEVRSEGGSDVVRGMTLFQRRHHQAILAKQRVTDIDRRESPRLVKTITTGNNGDRQLHGTVRFRHAHRC